MPPAHALGQASATAIVTPVMLTPLIAAYRVLARRQRLRVT
jgi:malonyl CoA-acyl carrier protein transacylase